LKTSEGKRTAVYPMKRWYGWRNTRWMSILVLVTMAAALLAGCGQQVPPYWPDLTVDRENNAVYVAEANGQIFALQADTGAISWSFPTISQGGGGLLGGCTPRTVTDGPFYAAPAFDAQYLYLGSAGDQQRTLFSKGENRAGLRVLDKSGIEQWQFKGVTDRTVCSPALSDTTVYLASSDRSVYAIDLTTHQPRWTFSTNNWVWATPLVIEGVVYVASMDHVLYAVNDQNGQQIWRFDGASSALPAPPAFAEGTLYLAALDGNVYAVNAETGELLWERKLGGSLWATPLLQDSVAYLGTLNGQIYALNATDGSEIWQKTVDTETRGTPAYANGTLYFGGENGQLYAFDATSGQEKASPLGVQLEGASIYTSPVFDGQRLYVVATDGRVFALDPEKGQVVWQRNPLSKE
jgi:outer membrane protein assembly factor BamB